MAKSIPKKMQGDLKDKSKEVLVSKPTFRQRLSVFKVLLFLILISFGVLTFFVKTYSFFKFDLIITQTIQAFKPLWFESLMTLLTKLGDIVPGTVVVILISLIFLLVKKFNAALMLLISSLGSVILAQTLKSLVGRERPDASLIDQIGKFTRSDSFPSGHVLFAVGLYGFLFFIIYTQIKKGTGRNIAIALCWIIMILMGLSRIYRGAHWFSDVLGAYLIGFVWLYLIIFVYNRLNPKVRPD